MLKQKTALLYPFLAIVLWAGNVIVSRLSAHTIGPQAITFYRLLLAVALMSVFVARPAWRNRAAIWPHFGQFAVLGFLAMCLFQSLSYLAAETTTATNMAVFTALTPLLTVALSAALLGEDPTLGMAGDHPGGAGIAQHRGGNVAGVGAACLGDGAGLLDEPAIDERADDAVAPVSR